MPQLSLELAKTVTDTGVKHTYGDPIVVDDVTIIPVACQTFSFGAGEGSSNSAKDGSVGSGGGGGGVSMPFGAYIKRGADLRFEINPVTLALVAIPLTFIAGRALARVIRALKR